MAKTKYLKRTINGKDYFYIRLRHKNLLKPKDIYAPTVKELNKKVNSMIIRLENNIIENKDYFESFFENWLFDVKFLVLKPSTKERYEGVYRNYIKNSSLSKIKIKDICLDNVQNYYNDLLKEGTSVSCIQTINKLIAPCIRYAYHNNILIKDFSKMIILPKEREATKLEKQSKVHPFSLAEQKRFTAEVRNHEHELLFLTALNSGLRQGELFALTWNDIDFNRCCINVNKTVRNVSEVSRDGRSKSKVIIQTPKSVASIRTVLIPYALCEKLKHHKTCQMQHKLKLANLYTDNNLVFCTPYGTYLDGSNIRKRMNKIIENINSRESNKINIILPRKFHDLRHTYATRLFELGESPKTIQNLLGHSNISVTLNTYTHVLERTKLIAVSKLNELYETM